MLELSRLAAQVAEEMDQDIQKASEILAECFRNNGKILVCGNGGSAADAQHFSGEFLSKYFVKNKALPAITLSADTSVLTALGNDYSFAQVFALQVEAYGKPGDVLVAISTSGRSANVVKAVETAKKMNLSVIALLGESGHPVFGDCAVVFHVPSKETPRIQEIHTSILHAIGEYLGPKLS